MLGAKSQQSSSSVLWKLVTAIDFSNFLHDGTNGSYLQSTPNYFLIYFIEAFLKINFITLIESTSRKMFA